MSVSRRHRDAERFDADLAMDVLAALDRQLAALTEIRSTLTAGRPSRPGARWHVAAASVVASRRFAREVSSALRTTGTTDSHPLSTTAQVTT